MSEILGYKVEELTGRPGMDLVADNEAARVREMSRKREQGVREQYELKMRRKDGSDVWLLASGTPFYNDSGQHIGQFRHVCGHNRAQAGPKKRCARARIAITGFSTP